MRKLGILVALLVLLGCGLSVSVFAASAAVTTGEAIAITVTPPFDRISDKVEFDIVYMEVGRGKANVTIDPIHVGGS